MKKFLSTDQIKLYDLIWRRSLSTQASQSISKIISIKVANKSNKIILTASTSELQFDGYKKIYQDEKAMLMDLTNFFFYGIMAK